MSSFSNTWLFIIKIGFCFGPQDNLQKNSVPFFLFCDYRILQILYFIRLIKVFVDSNETGIIELFR